jgi:hypothetical protein
MDEYELRREQKRQAQARYRKAHADQLRVARRVAHILARQRQWAGDVKELATAIRSLIGQEYARELGRELMARARPSPVRRAY